MKIKSECQKFAEITAKKCMTTYKVAIKKYPRYNNKSVWIDNGSTHLGHCVHCARAEAIIKYE